MKELVYYGIDQSQHTLGLGGTHLSPQDYHQKLASSGENTVVKELFGATVMSVACIVSGGDSTTDNAQHV